MSSTGPARPRSKVADGGEMNQLLRRAARTARRLAGHKPVEGFVDRVLAGEVLGWAFDPNQPERRVHVVARHEGEIVAEALADLPRKDLSRGGKGDGRHGFNLRVPGQYLDGAPRQLRIEAAQGRSNALLQGGVITIAATRPGLAAKKAAAKPQQGTEPGALDHVADGVLSGWAAPAKRNGAAPLVDVYDDERYLGSAPADRPRQTILDEAAPAAALGFQFRLPAGLPPEALGRLRARIAGGELDLRKLGSGPQVPGEARAAGPRGGAPLRPRRAARVSPPEGRVALLVYGEDDADAVRRTTRSWTDQSWSDVVTGRLTEDPGVSSPAAEHVFTADDLERLRQLLATARTVVFARAGETLAGSAAAILAQVRPLSDVLTWPVVAADGAGLTRRTAEAWPLALQLGASLNGAFAVRSDVLLRLRPDQIRSVARGAMDGLERALADDLSLGWAHLPLALSTRDIEGGREARRGAAEAPPPPRRLSLAVWPAWSDATLATLRSVLAQVGVAEVEVLAPADAASADLERELARMAPSASLDLRPIDPPAQERPAAWQRALSEAATGEVVLLCRAGVTPSGPAAALAQMAGWAMSPLVGAVTGEVIAGSQTLAGLAVAEGIDGWKVVSAHESGLAGVSRPVLAAPASFLAVERRKLSLAGGFDPRRLAGGGTGFELSLRLRRAGFANMVWGPAKAVSPNRLLGRDAAAAMAYYEVGELAAAAAAYPAPEDVRSQTASQP